MIFFKYLLKHFSILKMHMLLVLMLAKNGCSNPDARLVFWPNLGVPPSENPPAMYIVLTALVGTIVASSMLLFDHHLYSRHCTLKNNELIFINSCVFLNLLQCIYYIVKWNAPEHTSCEL